jgi:hypothetical protein
MFAALLESEMRDHAMRITCSRDAAVWWMRVLGGLVPISFPIFHITGHNAKERMRSWPSNP